MSQFSAQLHPGQALGFLTLGASLHDILTRLKAEPQRFPKLDLVYSPSDPVTEPVIVGLPANGIRLRFDGPEQRLRLIEVLDFTKNHIIFKEQNKDRELFKSSSSSSGSTPAEASSGPTFKHIYNRFLGPTYDGEFVPGTDATKQDMGTYVLSYPGVAFTFPMSNTAYSPNKDAVTLLSSSDSSIAISMAIFSGESWAQARDTLWTEVLPSINKFSQLTKGKDVSPEEISLIKIHGGGKLQLFKAWSTSSCVWITLGETTPQDLIAELGPPDAIYRKNEQRMYIHKIRTASSSRTRPNGADLRRHDPLTDTDQSSAHDDSDASDEAVEDDFVGSVSSECFYNYFYLGFDILVSTPIAPSRPPPSRVEEHKAAGESTKSNTADRLVATKMILHGNVPGSYPFNRHRRCRWEIDYLQPSTQESPVSSESPFSDVEQRLREEWKSIYASEDEAKKQQRGMVLNRGWGDSPGSSVELLGGWEGDAGPLPSRGVGGKKIDGSEDSTTTLYGFPGLVFEVLKNGFVSALTVF